MFYDLFLTLCQKKNVAPTRAALDIGLSKSAPIKWRTTGATPQGETLNKIASYFNVSTDYLLGTGQKEKLTLEDEQKNELLDSGFLRVMQKAKEKGYSPNDIQLVLDFLEQAKKRDEEN